MAEEKKPDTEAILNAVANASAIFQEALTPEERELMNRKRDAEDRASASYAGSESAAAELDFEAEAAADALETLAGQIDSVIQRRLQAAYEESLRVYYIAEELARDPAHAHLIPHVEAMRKAHRDSYGKEIPPKPTEPPSRP